jgi:hypothetical protein
MENDENLARLLADSSQIGAKFEIGKQFERAYY